MKNMKNLVIISGITGAIGNAFLYEYAKKENTVIYGLSRKGASLNDFLKNEATQLPAKTLITNIGELTTENIENFVKTIPTQEFESITYVHALGLFPFEINPTGESVVENDKDNDGINDEVKHLSHDVFVQMVTSLEKNVNTKIATVFFGSLSDHFKPTAHQSWWKTKSLVKKFMQSKSATIGSNIIDISSVICTHEIITRPFVFTNTDAEIKYWLSPVELTHRFFDQIKKSNIDIFKGFREFEIFNKKPGFKVEYYEDVNFTNQKIQEIYA